MRKIIAIEGIDGSGKTVQFNMLRDALRSSGFTVDCMDFPAYTTFFGEIIGDMLNGEKGLNAKYVDPMSMALWFASDRLLQLKNYKNDADFLLFNRYVLSNAAYQSARCDESTYFSPDEMIDWVIHMEHDVLELPVPDAYIFLNVTKEQAGSNVDKKGFRSYVGGERKDVYEGSEDVQKGAKGGYLRCAEKFRNVYTVECMRDGTMLPPDEIHGIIMDILRKNNIV